MHFTLPPLKSCCHNFHTFLNINDKTLLDIVLCRQNNLTYIINFRYPPLWYCYARYKTLDLTFHAERLRLNAERWFPKFDFPD